MFLIRSPKNLSGILRLLLRVLSRTLNNHSTKEHVNHLNVRLTSNMFIFLSSNRHVINKIINTLNYQNLMISNSLNTKRVRIILNIRHKSRGGNDRNQVMSLSNIRTILMFNRRFLMTSILRGILMFRLTSMTFPIFKRTTLRGVKVMFFGISTNRVIRLLTRENRNLTNRFKTRNTILLNINIRRTIRLLTLLVGRKTSLRMLLLITLKPVKKSTRLSMNVILMRSLFMKLSSRTRRVSNQSTKTSFIILFMNSNMNNNSLVTHNIKERLRSISIKDPNHSIFNRVLHNSLTFRTNLHSNTIRRIIQFSRQSIRPNIIKMGPSNNFLMIRNSRRLYNTNFRIMRRGTNKTRRRGSRNRMRRTILPRPLRRGFSRHPRLAFLQTIQLIYFKE